MLAGFSLFYNWQTGQWRGWRKIWHLAGECLIWGITAGLTIFALFPALWVIPQKVLTTSLFGVTDLASAGHLHFFLGEITEDPGMLFYPVGWLLRSSPLEVVGMAVLAGVVLYSVWKRRIFFLQQQLINRPAAVALFLYVVMFVIFETVSPKKMVRYLLPAFPVIDIFVAYGLLWLGDRLTSLSSGYFRQWRTPLLAGIVIVAQGWLLVNTFPYYFTYFNPLFGGASTAARIMDVSWGEGMDDAAAYLNQLPNADKLTVTICRNDGMFKPFFVGDDVLPCAKLEQIMTADYIVYYLYNRLVNSEDYYWPYFRDHQTPEYRATINGADYALVYRRPAQHQVSFLDHNVDDLLAVYGFDLEGDGNLRLYWHNAGVDQQQLLVGLAAPTGGEIVWVPCEPAQGFSAGPLPPDSIVESLCPLAAAEIPPNLYDVQLAVGEASGISPIESSGLAFVVVTSDQVELVKQEDALQQIADRGLPPEATPLDITYSDRMRLIGYRLAPAPEAGESSGEITLYWQPIRRPDAGLAQAFQLETQLLDTRGNNQPIASAPHPIFTRPVNPAETTRASIIPMVYTLPGDSSAAAVGHINICLKIAGTGQTVPATQGDTAEQIECVALPAPQETF
jgi:hypothetical protein